MEKDYYKILGIEKDSSEEEIKMAYKKLAMKYHPDRNPGDNQAEEKFKEIKNAYEYLTNKDNQRLDSVFEDLNFNNMNFSNFSDTESNLNDVFKIIFTKDLEKKFNNKIISSVNIDLEQAVYGSNFNIKFFFQIDCNFCSGKGFKLGNNVKVCNKCGGSGIFVINQGLFVFKQKCFKCEGRGYASVIFCKNCDSSGKVEKELFCSVSVSPNSDDESLAPIKYIGEDIDMILDDFYVLVKIKSHPFFVRKDNTNDIYCKFIIDFIKAVFGGYIKVYTFYGYIKYDIRKGSQSNETYRIKEMGLNLNKNFDLGDLYLEIFVEIPLYINDYQDFLIKQIKLSFFLNEDNYPLIFNWNNLIDDFLLNILIK
ncbi:Chaperone protein DnaJ [Candidatus Nasuia deltocephalinicola]|nr:Chaperone protein DnaJ [Candidatus Nasuia deltocephalinicola]